MKISNLARSAGLDAITALINANPPGHLYIRTGSAPTNTTDADSGTLLATLILSNTSFGASSSGVATAAAITDDSDCAATGTAAHFRIKDGNGVVIAQGTVTAAGGGGDITLNTTSIVQHGTCRVTSLTFTLPAT